MTRAVACSPRGHRIVARPRWSRMCVCYPFRVTRSAAVCDATAPRGLDAPGGSVQWQESAHPERLTGSNFQAWLWAQDTARRVLGGAAPDRTGGATHFHNRSMGTPGSIRGWFGAATRGPNPRLIQSPYRSPNEQNFFYLDTEDLPPPATRNPNPPPRR